MNYQQTHKTKRKP